MLEWLMIKLEDAHSSDVTINEELQAIVKATFLLFF